MHLSNKKLLDKIEKEGLKIIEKGEGSLEFSYIPSKNMITYPSDIDFEDPKNAFCLAHELGHYYQHISRSSIINNVFNIGRMSERYYLLFFPLIIIEELNAWVRAKKICKEEEVESGLYFISIASKCITGYLKSWINSFIAAFKFLIGLFVAIVFGVRFLKLSYEMDLEFYPFFETIRDAIISTNLSNTELVKLLFFNMLFTLLILEFIRFLMLFSNMSRVNSKSKK
ncbi:hypothetical protein [Bacillus cereus]|uniref:hypothetical protein n=1 Tax=Bacillus cereus group TaxID=86661 RepID=UPI0018A77B50|nr:hypothetical protein [Bacillus cereus]MBF8118232.1 hypothetical protein [Bacillus cereus]